jgi:hypothetical protein
MFKVKNDVLGELTAVGNLWETLQYSRTPQDSGEMETLMLPNRFLTVTVSPMVPLLGSNCPFTMAMITSIASLEDSNSTRKFFMVLYRGKGFDHPLLKRFSVYQTSRAFS